MVGKLCLLAEAFGGKIISNPLVINALDFYQPFINHLLQTGIGNAKGHPQAGGKFSLGNSGIFRDFFQ